VQHRMRESAAELWAWLEAGAHFYVCGDAQRMARMSMPHCMKSSKTREARRRNKVEYVQKLRTEKRYQRCLINEHHVTLYRNRLDRDRP
jgi:sulfite reductase (NADPH) flavoprotein alpha-component